MTPIEGARDLYIKESGLVNAGRGVFSRVPIRKGALIEQCPVIALHDAKERARLRRTGLVNYYFLWGEERNLPALCLGWGSVYNHSFSPNARYEKVMEENRMDFYALRDIAPDEEITVNYNGTPDDTTPLLVPGIPPEAGGPAPTTTPRFVSGILRRLRLLKRWVFKDSTFKAALLIPGLVF